MNWVAALRVARFHQVECVQPVDPPLLQLWLRDIWLAVPEIDESERCGLLPEPRCRNKIPNSDADIAANELGKIDALNDNVPIHTVTQCVHADDQRKELAFYHPSRVIPAGITMDTPKDGTKDVHRRYFELHRQCV
jgi:hypothetical protein